MVVDWLLVLAGGAVGAPVRYLTGVFVKNRVHTAIPWGTFAANVAAAFLLGFLIEAGVEGGLGKRALLLLATGFCGALSTWSTFSYELLHLTSIRRWLSATAYLLCSVGVGLALSFAGAALARAVW